MLLAAVLALAGWGWGCERRSGGTNASTTTGAAASTGTTSGEVRIVALSPALTRIARDLGAADKLVGRHAFDAWADPALPICGDQAGLDYETLIRVRPTHVLTQWGQREMPARLAELARERGWVIEDFRLLTLEDIPATAAALHEIVHAGHGEQRGGFDGTDLARRLQEAFAPRAGLEAARAGRVLMLYAGPTPAALGPGSWHHQLLERLGGVPAVTTGKPFQTLDVEDLARLKPDAIVVVSPRGAGADEPRAPAVRTRAEARAVLGRLADLDVPALRVEPVRVVILDDPLAAVPGTNLAELADELAEALGRWGR
jgi:ABC-type hemin transport system substrate-binding protein